MAYYKYGNHFKQIDHENFDKDRDPGTETPDAGIYRCTGCGDEIGIAKGHKLPPENHHQHTNRSVPIKWRLLVCTQSAG